MRTATDLTHKRSDSAVNDDNWLSYSQRTAHILSTKTGQYRRMRQDWRNCVVLGRSRIQGLGLFVKKSVEEVTIACLCFKHECGLFCHNVYYFSY